MTSPSAVPAKPALSHIAGAKDFAAAFAVSAVTVDRLKSYADSLTLWQQRINLVAPSTLPDVWHRHFADSAQLVDLAPDSLETWLDLGSGAGFPGMVAAILLAERPEPRPRVVLIESDQRKAAFLGEVVRRAALAPAISVDILCMRIETAATRGMLRAADVVSARALAPLEKLIGLASPLMKASGRGLFMKGRGIEAELAAARRSFEFSYDLVPSRTDPEARIVVMHGPTVGAEG